ncbi:hypothetical protein B1A99_02465 [Cohnella sp. CIP 111063]|uniref:response regulator n=1 Tax=unclassified Cohnella TaxID=2636738 RepID=UPI000B8BC447|nr:MULTISPECIES: response regulator [unclassified Cohnella]OXS62737.1 hypothetical protein B1A99_02465 [Cohnella sp. CIP 111063]PRX75010.1 two-component system response regulator YesN [Cohnella sp. SGD-V74]
MIELFKAIIVDDEPQIRKGLRTIISWEAAGFALVGEAADGEEALSLIQREPPDLVVTDVKMPRKDGIELSKLIRERYPDTVVLILSGYNQFSYAKEAMKHGVVDYLLKPVDPVELASALGELREKLASSVRHKLESAKAAKTMRTALLGKWVRGESSSKHYGEAAALGVDVRSEAHYRMIVFSLDRYDEIVAVSGDEIALKRFAIENVVEELLGDQGYLFEISDRYYGCLVAEREEGYDGDRGVCRLAEQIPDTIHRCLKETVTLGVGSVVQGIEQIQESYVTALKMMDTGKNASTDTENRIRAAIDYVGFHYMNDLNLKEMSRLFHYNAVYFGQLFRKETGLYFNDYMNQVRIEQACKLLEQTDFTAAEISEKVGYKYVDHFYRHFKQLKGLTPGKYRET